MLHYFSGSDRNAALDAMNAAVKKVAKGKEVVRITDAHMPADLSAALAGPGMFGAERVVVLNGVFASEEMRTATLAALKSMHDANEHFFLLEDKLDAATRKEVERYADDAKKFDAPKKETPKTIFALANAMRRGDVKTLWVAYQRELRVSAPEAIHGVLFWGAKQMYLGARGEDEKERAKRLVARLAELPHESRRNGVELEYSLERFVLSSLPAPYQNQRSRGN